MTSARPAVPGKCSREWLLSVSSLMAEDLSHSKPSLQDCACGPQNTTEEQLEAPEHSSSWQQHNRTLTFAIPFLWLSTQITEPLEGMQICVNLNYSQTCGCWKNGKTETDRNPGLVTQFSSWVYVKLSHPKWSFKPRVTDKKRDEIKCSCCSRHRKDC